LTRLPAEAVSRKQAQHFPRLSPTPTTIAWGNLTYNYTVSGMYLSNQVLHTGMVPGFYPIL
jgi:hypothetical protein